MCDSLDTTREQKPSAEALAQSSMDYTKQLEMANSSMFDFKGGILPAYHHPAAAGPYAGLSTLQQDRNSLLLSSFPGAMPHHLGGRMYDFPGQLNVNISPTPAKSPSPPPRVYKPCVVCNDKSSGYHYGVSSCEGCKGFFRRSVQKNIQYTCQKDSNCEINKVTRNRCQHCRLKKCFDKGMSKEAVRNDRKKKPVEPMVDKDKDSSSSTNNNNSSSGMSKASDVPVNYITDRDRELIETILDAHRATLPGGPIVIHKRSSICDSPSVASSPVPSTCSHSTGESSDNKPSPDTTTLDSMGGMGSPPTPTDPLSPGHRPGWENVHELNSEGIVKVVEFAKRIPNFLELSVSDQITLLKASCLEIMILRLTMRYNIDYEVLTFSNGVSVTMSEMEKGGFGPLAQTIFRFSTTLHELSLDEKEFALLSAICLLSSDRYGLENGAAVEKVQEPYLIALRHYSRQNHKKNPHLFAKLLMKLTDLRSISVKGAEKVLHLRQRSGDDPLVVEMFDRAENVCIP